MDEVRDKLVDMIHSGSRCPDNYDPFEPCDGCRYLEAHDCGAERLADYLIANGVTVQRWIPVTERLPLCGERVLITEGTTVFEAYLSISHKWVRAGIGWVENVTHWMPLPDAPKEDA